MSLKRKASTCRQDAHARRHVTDANHAPRDAFRAKNRGDAGRYAHDLGAHLQRGRRCEKQQQQQQQQQQRCTLEGSGQRTRWHTSRLLYTVSLISMKLLDSGMDG